MKRKYLFLSVCFSFFMSTAIFAATQNVSKSTVVAKKTSAPSIKFGDTFDSVVKRFEQRYFKAQLFSKCRKKDPCFEEKGKGTLVYFLAQDDKLDLFESTCLVGAVKTAKIYTPIHFIFDSYEKLEGIAINTNATRNFDEQYVFKAQVIREYKQTFGKPVFEMSVPSHGSENRSAVWNTSAKASVQMYWSATGLNSVSCANRAFNLIDDSRNESFKAE